MRLFVSLPVPPEPREHLARALAGVRTTDVAQWHVTLAFVGEWPDPGALVPHLAEAAGEEGPLRLRLEGGGSFPGVLWAGVAGDVDGLHRLAGRVTVACRAAGVALEPRRYRPHVTVARRVGPQRLAGYRGPEWTAAEAHLVRSTLGARAVHEVLESFPLGEAAR